MKRRVLTILAASLVVVGVGGGITYAAVGPDQMVFFDSEDFSLSQSQKDQLDQLLPLLETASQVKVEGYVQRSRPEDRNKGPARLSYKRADAVAKYLQNLVKQRSKNKQTIEWIV